MLGSLARKLRAFGFDTLYTRGTDDEATLCLARSGRRVLVTADRGLAAASRRSRLLTLLVEGETDSERIGSMVAGARAQGVELSPGPPLCSLCNGRLLPVARGMAAARVPPEVARRHRQFMECAACGKVYWKGGHWKKLRTLRRRFAPETRKQG